MGGPPTDDRRAAYLAASPRAHITRDTPPVLLIYGTADEQVPVASADDFVRKLEETGAPDVTYLRLAKVGHCPHSIQRVDWLPGVVTQFFQRSLGHKPQ
jgi:dipeptidyl aminopeptidase/acylaminoacyl peptidase